MTTDSYSLLPGRPDISGNPVIAQDERLKRKRAILAEQQRRVAEGLGVPTMPEGQMVSGHYVAPSWTESLLAASQPYIRRKGIEAEEKRLGEEENTLRATVEQEAEKAFAAGRDTEVAGPTQDGGPAVRKGDRVAMARQLGQLPGYQQIGQQVLGDEILQAPIRAEARADKAQARADAIEAKREERLAAAKTQAERDEAQRAFQREMRQMQQEFQGQLAAQASADRRYAAGESAEARRYAAELAAGAKANAPLPVKVIEDLSGMEDRVGTFKRLSTSFDEVAPDASGIRGAISSRVGQYKPGGSKAAQWWADYRRNSELAERNALFGASLTEGEKKAWQEASISPGMDETVIRDNLKKQEEIYRDAYNRQRKRYQQAGHNVERAFEPATAGPSNQQRTQAAGTVPAAPARVTSEAEVAKLPKGARFIGPDGNTYVK